jgi:hypothetical protein
LLVLLTLFALLDEESSSPHAASIATHTRAIEIRFI